MCPSVLPQRGTAILLEHLTGSLAGAISVSTHLDIAPQHHLFMMGRNGSNIKHITQRTGAQVHFPDPNSPQKKSTVYIQGTIESVCSARQHLMVGPRFSMLQQTKIGGQVAEWLWSRVMVRFPAVPNDGVSLGKALHPTCLG